jgi:hypothetical protein
VWLPRLDSNRHRHQGFLGFLKHLPEWLSLQQAAIVYGVSVDSLRRNRPRRASRIGGRLSASASASTTSTGLPTDPDGTFTASLGLVRVPGSVIAVSEGPDKGPG